MNVKARKTKNQVKVQNSSISVLSTKELAGRIETIKKELKSYTWRNLETNGNFVLWNGSKRLLKRVKLEAYLESSYSI